MIGINNIPFFEDISQYNKAINISSPHFEDIDIRRFEENMKTVPATMEPFRINFYQVALVMQAGGKVGQNSDYHKFENYTLFFNIPGQILCWDIAKNWTGYYISFQTSALSVGEGNPVLSTSLQYLKTGTNKFFELDGLEAETLTEVFKKMDYEYSNPSIYNKPILQSYLSVILNYGKRFYEQKEAVKEKKKETSSLTRRFEDALSEMFTPLNYGVDVNLKTVSELAGELHVSPKYLSEVLKEETGKTALEHIHGRLIELAKGLLKNTSLSISEIAYQLGFENPSYFSRLFKKQTGRSPTIFREED